MDARRGLTLRRAPIGEEAVVVDIIAFVIGFWLTLGILTLVWLWWDEVRYRRRRRHEDEAMRLANGGTQRHPSRRGPRGPEDEAGWTRFAWNKESDQ